MRYKKNFFILLIFSFFSFADQNIEKCKYEFILDETNRVNVLRLVNDNRIVRYFLELYLDAWEIDSPDDQLGGSLCIRLNKAGGKYQPGCLFCKKDSETTYLPSDCLGVFTKEMLEEGFRNSQKGIPIEFDGFGMRIVMKISKLVFSEETAPSPWGKKIKNLKFELEFFPDSRIPKTKEFTRKGLKK